MSLFFISLQNDQILDRTFEFFAFVVSERDRADVSVTPHVAFFDTRQRPQVTFDLFFLEKNDRSRGDVFELFMPLPLNPVKGITAKDGHIREYISKSQEIGKGNFDIFLTMFLNLC